MVILKLNRIKPKVGPRYQHVSIFEGCDQGKIIHIHTYALNELQLLHDSIQSASPPPPPAEMSQSGPKDYWRDRLSRVAPYWPRRLLHVQADRLVSVERTGECTYGTFEAPPYNILSYTWGRFQPRGENASAIPAGALAIENVAWSVPRVRSDHFTTAAFEQVLRRAAQGLPGDEGTCAHIWLDVACIHQEDPDEKLDEIGRQAAIFARARHAFIWLSHTPASRVRDILSLWRSSFHKSFAATVEDPDRDRALAAVQGWLKLHESFFGDAWFGSLWTLQEAFLRGDAVLLTEEHAPVLRDGDPVRLSDLTASCANFHLLIAEDDDSDLADDITPAQRAVYNHLSALIDKHGFRVLGVASAIELYATSDHKTPRNPMDKVYGIVQIFALSLGRANSLAELEDRLGIALNGIHPVFAQAFVHIAATAPRRSWRITPKVRVPWFVVERFIEPIPSCRIHPLELSGMSGVVGFDGAAAAFADCVRLWEVASDEDNWDMYGGRDLAQILYLDHTPDNKSRFPESYFQAESFWYGWEDTELEMNGALLDAFGSALQILLVGRAKVRCNRPEHRYASVGVIVRPLEEYAGQIIWARVGFAIWEIWSEEVEKTEGHVFQHVKNLCLG